jgi:UDP-N-acetylglucosamine 2-epimerase (non-hydrolysing)
VLVLRNVTERPEAVSAGTVRIIGTDEMNVYRHIKALITDPVRYRSMARAANPYGDGRAASRSAEAVRYFFKFRRTRPAEFAGARKK